MVKTIILLFMCAVCFGDMHYIEAEIYFPREIDRSIYVNAVNDYNSQMVAGWKRTKYINEITVSTEAYHIVQYVALKTDKTQDKLLRILINYLDNCGANGRVLVGKTYNDGMPGMSGIDDPPAEAWSK